MKNYKRKMINLSIAWIGYKETYDMAIAHSLYLDSAVPQNNNITDNIRNVIEKLMKIWKVN